MFIFFNAFDINVTSTASAAASTLATFRVASTTVAKIDKAGAVYGGDGSVTAPGVRLLSHASGLYNIFSNGVVSAVSPKS